MTTEITSAPSLPALMETSPVAVGILLAFVLGAMVGSFLNVCLYRFPRGESIFWPGSRCTRCLQPVRWFDNIPLLSYWVLRGRCRSCGLEFSSRYFWIELLTALGYAGLFGGEILLHNPDRALRAATLEISPQLFGTWAIHVCAVSVLLTAGCRCRVRVSAKKGTVSLRREGPSPFSH